MGGFSAMRKRQRHSFGGMVLVLAALALLACAKKSPEEDLLKKVEPVGSWLATLEMAGRKWEANSVPASFVETTLTAAGKEFGKAGEEAAKSSARPEVREAVRRIVAGAKGAGAGLRHAVEAGDRAAAAQAASRFAALGREFEALQRGFEPLEKAAGGES
jgi:hypothetical protein